ncbi:MAG: RNA polymerase sporulation sigma factor SigE, partial [Clostridia bacterium]|nr:RNA polymerase sporulation sigma factor SigE [Clostridia bacterium]
MLSLKHILASILLRLGVDNPLDYIHGPDVLPAPLDREEEAALLKRLAAGDENVKSTLITHNLRLVVYIARKFEAASANIEDLISIGTIGLIKAVNT